MTLCPLSVSTDQGYGEDHQGLRTSFCHPLGRLCHCLNPEGSVDPFVSAVYGSWSLTRAKAPRTQVLCILTFCCWTSGFPTIDREQRLTWIKKLASFISLASKLYRIAHSRLAFHWALRASTFHLTWEEQRGWGFTLGFFSWMGHLNSDTYIPYLKIQSQ